jgi:Tfp pilus assembly protein PilN
MIEINLLPKELQIQGPRLSFSKALAVPAIGAVALVIALAALTVYQKKQVSDLEGKIKVATARAEQLQKDIEMVDALVEIKQKITARIDAVKLLDRNRRTWVSVMEDLSGRMPEFLWLTAVREVAPAPTPGTATTAAAQADTTAKTPATMAQKVPAEIEGYAYSLNSLANLILNMRESGFFTQVDLAQAREVALEKHPAYSFTLNCSLDYSGKANEGESQDVAPNQELASTPKQTD